MVASLSEGSNGMRHPFSKRFTRLNQHTIRTVCEATGLTPRNFCRGVMGGAAEAATSFGTLVYEAHAGRTPSFVRLVTKAA